jgi:cyclic pyranopterin phosphate synthase
MNKDTLKMIDISEKENMPRRAVAIGKIKLRKETLQAIIKGDINKGDPLIVAKIAGIQAVKKTPELIPMCHPIPISGIDLEFNLGEDTIKATCSVIAYYKTGVEMEALTGVSVALLNIWDMVKYLEKDSLGEYPTAEITGIRVIEKVKGEI